jgi:hypothetical protein
MRFSRRSVEDIGLLRMTDWVAEITTSSNQKTIRFLVMTVLDRYFHCHLVPQSGMKVYPKNKGMSKK